MISFDPSLPSDVASFYELVSGGSLFYHRDYPNPQFGCELGLIDREPISTNIPCTGSTLNQLFEVASGDTGSYDIIAVDTSPDRYGQLFFVQYSLGDPELTDDSADFLCSSFRRWLEIHIEAWSVYEADWRSGLSRYRDLLDREAPP